MQVGALTARSDAATAVQVRPLAVQPLVRMHTMTASGATAGLDESVGC